MIPEDPVGTALMLAASIGVAGAFLLALFERLVPILPSAGVFAAIGVASAEGLWCLPVAAVASVLGSSTGAYGTYELGAVVHRRGKGARLVRVLRRRDRWGRMVRASCRGAAALPFTAQLLPAARILVPLFAAAARHDRRRFLLATGIGLTLWNVTFIGIGYAVAWMGGTGNLTAVSLAMLVPAACLGAGGRWLVHARGAGR